MAYREFIDSALRDTPITLYGSGDQSRSNTFIDDCVRATIAGLELGDDGEIFNIAGGEERTINDALSIIESEVGKTLSIERHDGARGDQARTAGDSRKAKTVLGFRYTVGLEEGLARQVRWQRGL